jgi:hypothetical protein
MLSAYNHRIYGAHPAFAPLFFDSVPLRSNGTEHPQGAKKKGYLWMKLDYCVGIYYAFYELSYLVSRIVPLLAYFVECQGGQSHIVLFPVFFGRYFRKSFIKCSILVKIKEGEHLNPRAANGPERIHRDARYRAAHPL